MAHPTDPRNHRRREADVADTETTDAEIIEAEVVDDEPAPAMASPASRPSHPGDDDEFHQYQQFLEFQRFQQYQRMQRDGQVDPSASRKPPTKWWKRALRLLRYKLVRRLLYVVLIALLINLALDYYFGGGAGNGAGSGGTNMMGNGSSEAKVLPDKPEDTVRAVYQYIAANKPGIVCVLFGDAKDQFARAHGAPDCPSAVKKLNKTVQMPKEYKSPTFGPSAVRITKVDAVVWACETTVRGGPRLGNFDLKPKPGGWIIDGYEPARC